MQSTKLANKLLFNNKNPLAELKEPLLPVEYKCSIKKKPPANEEIHECIGILKKRRRKAFCMIWTMRLSVVVTATAGLCISLLKYFKTENEVANAVSAETVSISAAQTQFANQFNTSLVNQTIPCQYYYPNSLSMMRARTDDDCCQQDPEGNVGPCLWTGDTIIQPCFNIVANYCFLKPTIQSPSGYLKNLILGSCASTLFIVKEITNSIIEALGKDFVIIFFPMSRLERCFVKADEMQRIREVAGKYGIILEDKYVRKMLLAFENYNKRYANKIAFFSGSHSRLGENSPLFDLFESEIYDQNVARHILEFTGDNPAKMKDVVDEPVVIQMDSDDAVVPKP